MKRPLPWLILIVVAAGICWWFPLFRVVSLHQAAQQKAAATFNPAEFAARLWTNELPAAYSQAVPATELVALLRTDAAASKTKFSRSIGVSESYTFFLAGQGRVLAVSDDEISLAVTPGSTNAEVALQMGLLFGNAVRDGTGLLNVNDYPNSQDFNALSEALNHLVETRVQPRLRAQAKIGGTIGFVGCAEVGDETTDLRPLKVVPIHSETP
jgi:predicted lipoprotein